MFFFHRPALAGFWAAHAASVKQFMEKYGISPFLGVLFFVLLALLALYLGLLVYQKRYNKKATREWKKTHKKQ
ncbi:MAG: hypothetical protein FWD16_04640 [Clostridia bacterium]|nr:hypothetical protein [Clostridia bacterium]